MSNETRIPDDIRAVFEGYWGPNQDVKLENALATRKAPEWFAILFKDTETDELFAVDFRINSDLKWEVQNDYVGPFKSIMEFRTVALTQSFL
jgi:hypothetical protein